MKVVIHPQPKLIIQKLVPRLALKSVARIVENLRKNAIYV